MEKRLTVLVLFKYNWTNINLLNKLNKKMLTFADVMDYNNFTGKTININKVI